MKNLTKIADALVSGDIITIEDRDGLAAMPEGTVLADADGDLVTDDYVDAWPYLPAIVLNPEHLGDFEAPAKFHVGDKVQIADHPFTNNGGYVSSGFHGGRLGTIVSTSHHSEPDYGYEVRVDDMRWNNYIGEDSLRLVKIAKDTPVRVKWVRGARLAENGSLATVTANYLEGDDLVQIKWRREDPRTKTQVDGSYYAQDFEVLEEMPQLGVIRAEVGEAASLPSFRGLVVEDRGEGGHCRWLPLTNRPDGHLRSPFIWPEDDIVLGTTVLPEPEPVDPYLALADRPTVGDVAGLDALAPFSVVVVGRPGYVSFVKGQDGRWYNGGSDFSRTAEELVDFFGHHGLIVAHDHEGLG